jgi:threonine/homoserine/homoserine lactone efflux protein
MTPESWLLYVVTVFFVSATPGPNMLLAMTHGIQYGLRRALVTSLGLMSGLGIIMAASSAGLGALLAASGEAFAIMKYAGAAYLIWLGVKVWRAEPQAVETVSAPGERGQTPWMLFRTGVLVSLSNPKAFVFFTALFPQFLDAGRPQGPQFFVLVATFVVIESAWQVIYAGGGAKLARWLNTERRLRLVNRLSGAAFIGAGLLLTAVSRR